MQLKILMMASSTGVGLTYHLAHLSINLKKEGHDVTVLSGPNEQVVGLSSELLHARIEHFTSFNVDKKTILDICNSSNDIRRIFDSKDIDVIHAQGVTDTLESYLATRPLPPNKRPHIVTSIHSIPTKGFIQNVNWTAMTMILNVCADVILPVSNDTRTQLIGHGVFSKKTITVHNAIDLETFDSALRTGGSNLWKNEYDLPVVVYAGNLIPRKGQDYYLMAAAEVLKNEAAQFYVVGSGPMRIHLEQLVHNLKIDKYVVFTGRIPWPELYFLLSNIADICVSASIGELFPFYVIECMASGKPIVATNVGGVSDAVIDGVTGYIIPPKDPASLAIALRKLLDDPDRARQMGIEARKIVEQKFSMKVLTKKLGEVYEIASKPYVLLN